jgi:hypothetical protein
MNLFDIMRNAGGGNAFADLGPRYGLSAADMARAAEAFLPAFSAGLKQRTADPFGMGEFMRLLSGGDFFSAYRNPAAAAAKRPGEEALAFLFGSPEAARAVAAQAASFTGLAQEKMAEMMPALAAMTLGGLAQQSAAENPVFEAMMRHFSPQGAGAAGSAAGAAGAAKPAGKGPLDRYEEEQDERGSGGAADMQRAHEEMMAASLAALQASTAAWREAVSQMLKAGGPPGGPTVPSGEASPGPGPGAGAAPTGQELFGEMLEPGIRVGEAYQRQMQAVLEQFSPKKT